MEEEKKSTYNLSNALIEEHKRRELEIDIDEKLEPAPECCIYRVPKNLRQLKEDAYTPQSISIGPFHHGKQEFASMEKQKFRYKKIFGERIGTEKWEDFITFIKDHEQDIRNCYAETFSIRSFEFVSMILFDAVFIIELLLQHCDGSKDFLLDKLHIRDSIWLDLQLLENQLPYFVLEQLYESAELPRKGYPDFFSLSCLFFSDSMFNVYSEPDQVEVKHFLDLRRCALVMSYPKAMSRGVAMDLPCAVKLHESGVKFKCIKAECLLDIRFEKIKRRIPGLNVDELQIPNVKIYDETDCLFRNLMALEQCHYQFETHVCNYIDLMDFLVNTEKDVELLVEAGIISNCVGDNDAVAKMFNQLCLQINRSYSCYYDIVKDLRTHYHNPWNRRKATLKSVYFNNIWIGTGTIAAIILLLLTFIQTVFSILQVVLKK